MYLYRVPPVVFGNEIGAGLKTDVSGAPLCSAGNQLHARSKRTAPCSVSRFSVHWSWAYKAWYSVRLLWSHGAMRMLTEYRPGAMNPRSVSVYRGSLARSVVSSM